MLNHPELMLDLARLHNDDLIVAARRFQRGHRATLEATPEPHRAGPAPSRPSQITIHNKVDSVGRLSGCETPRELTAGRAR
jgi:hypothetical protein